MAKVILDAGHGGAEPGAQFEGRQEKNDTLRLTLAVGDILEKNGVDVVYTRTEDVYDTPLEKAQIANQEGGDFLISFHRNSSPQPNQYSGVESLVYDRSGKKAELAEAINEELEQVGFRNLGIVERPGLIILRRTQMPAVLVEAGFLNTDADNQIFDEQFGEVAQAIANGILRTLRMEELEYAQQTEGMNGTRYAQQTEGMNGTRYAQQTEGMNGTRYAQQTEGMNGEKYDQQSADMEEMGNNSVRMPDREKWQQSSREYGCDCMNEKRYYRVQTGAFRNQQYAQDLLYELLQQNYPAYILLEDGLYKVQVGAFLQLNNAVRMEQALRNKGYHTFITA